MAERLVVVEEAFVAGGRGVLIAPKITLAPTAPAKTAPFEVRLRRPDGSELRTRAAFEVAHIRGPLAPYAMIRLPDASPVDAPAGTEIWTTD